MSSSSMHSSGGPRIVLVVRNDLTRDNRIQKEARALGAAGYDVWCVGIIAEAGQAQRETTEYGEVVRVLTTKKLQVTAERPAPRTQLSSAQGARVYGGFLGSVRHYVGRIRENRLLADVITGLGPDLVIAHDPDSSLAALDWSRTSRRPVGYDAREVWTEQRPDAHWFYKWLWARVEKRIMQRAAFSMTVNDPIARELERRYGVKGVVTVYNGSGECIDASAHVASPVRLLFQGSFAADRNLPTLVRAMQHLRGHATLALQGYGEMEEALRRLVEEIEVGDIVTFVPACAPSDVVKCAAEYDVGVICHLPISLNHQLAAPNKLFDYMGAGLAIAGSDLPVIRQIVGDSGCGATVDPTTPESLARGLRALVEDPSLVQQMKAASANACAAFSWKAQAAKELVLVRRAIGEPR